MSDEHFIQPKITGYRQLTAAEADLMNLVKEKANEIGVIVDRLMLDPNCDTRWVAIGRTNLQQGFMAVVRGIAKPDSF
jgi:hypothetical protein